MKSYDILCISYYLTIWCISIPDGHFGLDMHRFGLHSRSVHKSCAKDAKEHSSHSIQCTVFQPCCAIQCQAKCQGKRQNQLASAVSALNIWNMSHAWADRVKQHMRFSNPGHQTAQNRIWETLMASRPVMPCPRNLTLLTHRPAQKLYIKSPIQSRRLQTSLQFAQHSRIGSQNSRCLRHWDNKPNTVFSLFQQTQIYSTGLTARVYGLHGGFFKLYLVWAVESWEPSKRPESSHVLSLRSRDTMRYLHNLQLHPLDLEGVQIYILENGLNTRTYKSW